MKGVHPVLSHSLLLMIGVAAMGLVILSISSTFSKTERNLVMSEISYVSELVRARIMEAYTSSMNTGNFSGNFVLALPEKIGDQRYVVALANETITVRIPFENEMLEVNKTVSINAQLSGESMMPASLSVEKAGETITMDLV
jgi:hypothetical protein